MKMSAPAVPQRKPRVIFINRFYWPDEPATAQLLTDLAESLAERGHDVTVITRQSREAVPREATRNGVKIHRIPSASRSGVGLFAKAQAFASFFWRALLRLIKMARSGDCLVALTDPPLLGIGVWLVARAKGARVFHWIQDIYPELALELAGQDWLRMIRPFRNAAWRGADHCVTLGSDMAGVLANVGVPAQKISVIPNWAPLGVERSASPETAGLRVAWDLAGKFVVAYSGNLGRVHDLQPVLEVAAALRENREIAFVFIGHGAQRPALEAETARRGLSNVSFRPAQPRERLGETLALGDLHLVTLRPGCERLVFPSKLYGIAAAGRPVIFIGPEDCDIARQITRHAFGISFRREQTPAIAATIQQLKDDAVRLRSLGAAAAKFHAATGATTAAAEKWSALLAPPGELVPATAPR